MRVRLTLRMKNHKIQKITAVRMEKTQKESLQMKRRKEKQMESPLLLPVKRK